ncbi:MAG: IS1595 family transposase [Chloroflexi bacterium]|nr:IS1595 family transposase [Chloroflexota bacterium]
MSSHMSLVDAVMYFGTEVNAERWFEKRRWKNGIRCAHCESRRVSRVSGRPQPFRCRQCWKYFSVKTNTIMQSSKLPLSKWAITCYLIISQPKGISSIQLAKHIGVQQRTAWLMLHKIREIWNSEDRVFLGPVEVDEAYIGGLEKNKHAHRKLRAGRGGIGKTTVVGIRDRATKRVFAMPVERANSIVLHHFVHASTFPDTSVSTDDNFSYRGIRRIHGAVSHTRGEYVRDWVSTNGIESFWPLFKRGFKGTYHQMSRKHLQRYLNEFMGRNRLRRYSIEGRMSRMVWEFEGKQITYHELING